MNTEILGIIAMFTITLLLAIPFREIYGKGICRRADSVDPVFNPVERLFFKLSGINTKNEMTWKQHLMALLTINLLWFLMSMFILMNMSLVAIKTPITIPVNLPI